MARPPPLLGPRFRGQMQRAGRAHVCAKESGCRRQGTRIAGARAPHGARRLRARDPRAQAWPPACLASPSRALSSTVFATMFSSSMGCSAARPTRPCRRPGPPTRAEADGDRRGSARLGSARLTAPRPPGLTGLPGRRRPPRTLCPSRSTGARPAPPSVYLTQSMGERTLPAPGYYWSDSFFCPAHGAGNSLPAGRGRAPLRRRFLVGLRTGFGP